MPIDLLTKPRGQIRHFFEEVLATSVLRRGNVVSTPGLFTRLEEANALVEKLRAADRLAMRESIDDIHPLVAFFESEIREMVERAGVVYDRDAPNRPLTAVKEFANLQEVAEGLLHALESLPHQYVASLPLRSDLASTYKNKGFPAIRNSKVALAGSWHDQDQENVFPIVEAGKAHEQASNLLALMSLADLKRTNGAPPPVLDLQIRLEGYISKQSPWPMVTQKRFTSKVQALIGVLIGVGALNYVLNWERREASYDYSFRQKNADKWSLVEKFTTISRMSKGLSFIELAEAEDVLTNLQDVIRLFGDDSVAPRLKLAGRWYFESLVNDDPVMAYMQLAIVSEVLLESEAATPELGTTKLLANRCAYLIANSAKERQQIFEDFKGAYAVRSKIVHAGVADFTHSDHQFRRKLKPICHRLMKAELKLALGDLV